MAGMVMDIMGMLTHQQQRVVLAVIGLLMLGCAVKAWHPRVPRAPHSNPSTLSDNPSQPGDLPTHSTPDP